MLPDLVGSEWEPILEGTLADDARRAVLDVARAIAAGQGEPARVEETTLFWAYVAGAFDDGWIASEYDRASDALCESIGDRARPSLFGGIAGTGFVLAHISDGDAAEQPLAAIDDYLMKALDVERWVADYDLIGGLVGIAVYFLERLEHTASALARRGLERVLEHLSACAEQTPLGTTWLTRPELLPESQQTRFPDGYYNCGLAHGVPGVVAVLGRLATMAEPLPRARELGAEAVRWLLGQRLDDPGGSYPASFRRDDDRTPTRTAWCYGDPGVAIAMWSAQLRLGLPTADSIELAKRCALRPADSCGVVDPGLCHGSTGLAHICNHFYQTSRDPVFRDASRAWFQRALDQRRNDGVGGFTAWMPREHGFAWVAQSSLLEGATGVALALLAGLEPTEPAWDRLVQCDLPRL